MAVGVTQPNIGSLQPNVDIGSGVSNRAGKADGSFEKLLRERIPQDLSLPSAPASGVPASQLKFSSHAMSRIKERSIEMNKDMVSKLEKAVDSAAQKGAKESLILTSDAAFIVSVKNKTVITVVDRNQMSGNVFTNIDSTVLI